LAHAHVVVRTESVGHVSHEAFDLRRITGAIDAGDPGRAARRTRQPHHDLDGGRLSGSVGADQSENPPGRQTERKIVQGREFTITLGAVFDLNDSSLGTHFSTRSASAAVARSFRPAVSPAA